MKSIRSSLPLGVLIAFVGISLASATILIGSTPMRVNQLRFLAERKVEGGPSEQWFTQYVDHFNKADTRTWKQRYFVNDTFWNPDLGGPIFLQVGGEGAISSAYVTALEMAVYAQKFGALQVAVEHRFYGKSQPFSDWSNQNLAYLSSQQALADLAYFISSFKAQYKAQDAPVVTFGGSYPGNLAAWFRLKFPHLTVGSVASSAPVQAVLDFYQYLDVVDSSLTKFTGLKCDQQITAATNKIQTYLQTQSGQTWVQNNFKLCGPLKTALDISNFMSTLMGNWMGTVQYNDEGGNPIDIKYLCGIMDDASDPLAGYIQINEIFLNGSGQSCMDVSYNDMIVQLKSTTIDLTSPVGYRQWTYQTCTEFGYFQTTDSEHQPFGNLVPLSFYTDICRDVFGFNFDPRINDTNDFYGGNDPVGATEILFVNGDIDPWHALSVTEDLDESLTAILIDGTAHCADMLPARPQDPPGLAIAQAKIARSIGEFLVRRREYKK